MLSYLVSTAGHAQTQNEAAPHDVQSILQLLGDGAEEFKDEAVVGFARLTDGLWDCETFCTFLWHKLTQAFPELINMANATQKVVSLPSPPPQIVAMLCPTGVDFLVTWIALMRMGLGTVLIAPQCSPSAIAHLCQSTNSAALLFHPKYRSLASAAAAEAPSLVLCAIPLAVRGAPAATPTCSIDPSAISHVFHSSGTSGNPKPIPHTHFGSVAPLPRRPLPKYMRQTGALPSEGAAFTTTPLFHGGISDLLRAWMARSMIYFFPTSDTPITEANVVGAVGACGLPRVSDTSVRYDVEERRQHFSITSFLSVPYILKILTETGGAGLSLLKRMELVSTGGAPLDQNVGDAMVQEGVRLVSRLGSSECGFLLSSYRDFGVDKEWNWLRNDSAYSNALRFEAVTGTSYELVVTSHWSSKTKTNRDDGSYATGDLFEPHTTKRNCWRYIGRGDDVVVLVRSLTTTLTQDNGEKFAPDVIEAVFSSSGVFADALVIGENQNRPGVMLFAQSGKGLTEEVLRSLMKTANDSLPTFAQLSRDMILVLPESRADDIPRSSKGTTQRRLAYDFFHLEIARMYASSSTMHDQRLDLDQIRKAIRQLLMAQFAAGNKAIGDDEDFFSHGVTSLMSVRIRNEIMRTISSETQLPTSVVFEHPTIDLLSRFLFVHQDGVSVEDPDYTSQMQQLVDKYSFRVPSPPPLRDAPAGKTIVSVDRMALNEILTGATGSLGSQILRALLRSDAAAIVCLIRASDDDAARRRLTDVCGPLPERVTALSSMLHREGLGLQEDIYQDVANNAHAVIHAAWPVNFANSLPSFEDSLKGLNNLLQLISLGATSRLIFCSSLASVLGGQQDQIAEQPTVDPATATHTGYSRSKWVAEQLCTHARDVLGDRISVARIGQLCGDTVAGRWNEKEGWPMMFRSAASTGVLPELGEAQYWLPVDVAAQAVYACVRKQSLRSSIDIAGGDLRHSIYHVVNPMATPWGNILDGLQRAGLSFARVQPLAWIEAVEKHLPEKDPARLMLPLWRASYGSEPAALKKVDTGHAMEASPSLRTTTAVSPEHISLVVASWRELGFMP